VALSFQKSWLYPKAYDPFLVRVFHGQGRFYSFDGGVESLYEGIEAQLRADPHVTVIDGDASVESARIVVPTPKGVLPVEGSVEGSSADGAGDAASSGVVLEFASNLAGSSSPRQERVSADVVVSALAAPELAALLENSSSESSAPLSEPAQPASENSRSQSSQNSLGLLTELSQALRSIPHASCGVVSLAWRQPERQLVKGGNSQRLHWWHRVRSAVVRGAGYFAPSWSPVSAVVFHSQLFPQSTKSSETVLTLFLPHAREKGLDNNGMVQAAQQEVGEMLGIDATPAVARAEVLSNGLPSYAETAHRAALQRIWDACNQLRRRTSSESGDLGTFDLQVVGRSFFGSSLPAEVVDARRVADQLARRYANWPRLVERDSRRAFLQRER